MTMRLDLWPRTAKLSTKWIRHIKKISLFPQEKSWTSDQDFLIFY